MTTIMKISVETIVSMIEEAIIDNDVDKTLQLVGKLKESAKKDPDTVKWIVNPTNLQGLHSLLVEYLEVPQSVMRVKHRSENRTTRAIMFIEAMEHGIKRIL